MSERIEFLEKLLDCPGPSGFETGPARVWREAAGKFSDEVWTDVTGNSVAGINLGGKPRVMLAGHIDEIGLQVTHIDENGFLFFDEIGGWDSQVLVGQRVLVLGSDKKVPVVPGVIGKKPIHLLKKEEQSNATKTRDLWVDLGCSNEEEVAGLGVRVGDPMVLSAGMIRLAGDRIASRSIDNRIGAYVVWRWLRFRRRSRSRGVGHGPVPLPWSPTWRWWWM
jgi:putative aminopeptidase FrvX